MTMIAIGFLPRWPDESAACCDLDARQFVGFPGIVFVGMRASRFATRLECGSGTIPSLVLWRKRSAHKPA
jgi:hypothetical protein